MTSRKPTREFHDKILHVQIVVRFFDHLRYTVFAQIIAGTFLIARSRLIAGVKCCKRNTGNSRTSIPNRINRASLLQTYEAF